MSQKKYEAVSKDIEMGTVKAASTSAPVAPVTAIAQPAALSVYELFVILSPYFWPSGLTPRLLSTSTWLMVALSKASSLIAPYFLSMATNRLIDGQFHTAAVDLAVYTVLRFMSSFFKEMQSILYIKVKQQAGIELQKLTFAHLHTLSLNWHLSKKTGSVMKSMDRGVDAANSLVSYLFLFLVPAIMEVLAVVILFFLQFKQYTLGIVVFVGVALYSMFTIYITLWRKKFREQTNKHDNEFHEKATDSILNYETVKYFTNERFEVDRFTSSVEKYQVQVSATTLSLSLLNITQQFILNLTMVACMLIAGKAVVSGNMSIGSWVAVQSWVATIFVPLNFLGSVYGAIYQAFIDIRNLSELLAQGPEIVDKPGAVDLPLPSQEVVLAPNAAPIKSSGLSVEFRDVVFHYATQPPEKGLQHVSFTVGAGTTTALVGHTGSGKTTLSRLLFRFYDPLSGSVLINGHDIKLHTQSSVRKCIGVVPQDTVLFNDTILHNVRYGRMDATMEEVVQAADAAQILNFIESLPEKWNTVVGERGLKLSGGEKQRVAIARCLLKNPPIVLLDEATSALDTLTENSIQEALHALGQNRTVIVIAHRLSTIRHAQQIVVMDGGKVLERGSHEELLRIPDGQYRDMWEMQIRSNDSNAAVEDAESSNADT